MVTCLANALALPKKLRLCYTDLVLLDLAFGSTTIIASRRSITSWFSWFHRWCVPCGVNKGFEVSLVLARGFWMCSICLLFNRKRSLKHFGAVLFPFTNSHSFSKLKYSQQNITTRAARTRGTSPDHNRVRNQNMYNGIGLQTARGSGTNGYVQKNTAHLPKWREKVRVSARKLIARLNMIDKQDNGKKH